MSSERLMSLDAYRGFIMLSMASASLGVPTVAATLRKNGEETPLWHNLAGLLEHVPWVTLTNVPESMPLWGLSVWDMIQPAFMFMVGVALPYSYANRQARGESNAAAWRHAILRAVVLVLMGVFLSTEFTFKRTGLDADFVPTTNWTFANVLCQIGLGYLFLFGLAQCSRRAQVASIVFILLWNWWAFYQYQLPDESTWAQYGITDKERSDGVILDGFQRPWSKNVNFAAAVDRKLLNWLPREKPFEFNTGGYATLNFIPALATMILGLLAGEVMRTGPDSRTRLRWLLGWGAVLLGLGIAANFTICPIVKRIWTPAWMLYSGGGVLWMLAGFYWLVDVVGCRRWAFPLVVVGMNSIAMYMMSQMIKGSTRDALIQHFQLYYGHAVGWINAQLGGELPSRLFSGLYGPIVERLSVLLVLWLVCLWMYRQKIFVRI